MSVFWSSLDSSLDHNSANVNDKPFLLKSPGSHTFILKIFTKSLWANLLIPSKLSNLPQAICFPVVLQPYPGAPDSMTFFIALSYSKYLDSWGSVSKAAAFGLLSGESSSPPALPPTLLVLSRILSLKYIKPFLKINKYLDSFPSCPK